MNENDELTKCFGSTFWLKKVQESVLNLHKERSCQSCEQSLASHVLESGEGPPRGWRCF